ncbi:putative dinucleotide-binding enzyme [Arthrobacter stackebrandtii]|uniref:Dinucleotide-binding enzyme n=1 Tax=Arthrobacter stackebrandtii TaxID=272161 RepID=A0ABS4YU78_9MICC|nr:NAD(P)-binding domain-containing protein [Arthrobacter stackebrandtii]MBP2412326.1 putative dinucleotide-binding enzyme [Arthrobacter stackebrandtii]PYH02103.1 NADP oxidoreductase [Arthrobacter stackebrandtii]
MSIQTLKQHDPATTTIGILGAGKVGTGVARQAIKAGYRVLIAASGDPKDISLIISVMAPGAVAVSAAEAMAAADLVVLSVPLHKFRTLDPAGLAGKHVLDTMNYWRDTNGDMPELEAAPSSSEMVHAHIPGARLAKSLNHIGYHELELDARPAGAPDRRALAVTSDDGQTRDLVLGFVEHLGFDAVDGGSLAGGAAFEPGTPIFTGSYDRPGLQAELLAHAAGATGEGRELAPAH